MSATNARQNVTPMESVRRKMNFQLIDSVLVLLTLALAIIGIGSGVFIAFNLGDWQPSFWLGLTAIFVVALIVYAMWWASHPKTKTWPGLALGLVDLIVAVGALALFFTFADKFAWDKFGWGLLVAVILAAVYAVIKVYGWLSRRAYNR